MIYSVGFVLFLLITANVAQQKIDKVEEIQNLILQKINETAPEFKPCNENLAKKAKFGDLIEIERKGYFHWAVFIQNLTVIQLDNPEFDKLNIHNVFKNFTGHVELRDLMDLAGNNSCRINNKMDESKRKGLQVLPNSAMLKQMKEELKNNVTWYNLITNNCEHFAAKMRFGTPFSSQIEAAKQIVNDVKDKLGETVEKMFKIAASFKPHASDKHLVDMSSINV